MGDKIQEDVMQTVTDEKEAASKVNLDSVEEGFGDSGLDEGNGKSDAGKKPARTGEKVPSAPLPKPKPEQTVKTVSKMLKEAADKGKKAQTVSERLKEIANAGKKSTPKKEKKKKQIITQEDGHTYAGDDPMCRVCALLKDNTTTICFGKPLFPSTLKKFNKGLIDFKGSSWLPK